MRLRVFGFDERHLVYRKGLSHNILKDMERERKLAAKKEMGRLAIEDKDKGRKKSSVHSLCISWLIERNSDTSLPHTDRPALIPTPNRIVPLPPLIRTLIRTQALVEVAVAVAVAAHFQEKQTVAGADRDPATRTSPLPVHALFQCCG